MTQNIICISCPVGCPLIVTLENGQVTKVEGQGCNRGELYAKKECVAPARIFTSSVPVKHGIPEMLSIKSASDIPKSKLFEIAEALKGLKAEAPVKIGDVVLADAAGTGVDLIATRNIASIAQR